ncbi:hypothetical protein RUM44_005479, partial [Polyplax serrata]
MGVHIGLCIVLIVTYIACYYKSLYCGFVLDDISAIKDNRNLRPYTPVKNIFLNDFCGTQIQKVQARHRNTCNGSLLREDFDGNHFVLKKGPLLHFHLRCFPGFNMNRTVFNRAFYISMSGYLLITQELGFPNLRQLRWGETLHWSRSRVTSLTDLCVLRFRWNYAVHQLEPFGYHLVNVALHVVVSILYDIMCIMFMSDIGGFMSSILFAVHPIHTEA